MVQHVLFYYPNDLQRRPVIVASMTGLLDVIEDNDLVSRLDNLEEKVSVAWRLRFFRIFSFLCNNSTSLNFVFALNRFTLVLHT